jgi:type VI secretion system protein ImpG
MLPDDATLKDYFRQELNSLREDAEAFARGNPEVARALTLQKGQAHDPHVEMLMQSFAWLTGRLHYEMEEDRAALPNALLDTLYPHLAAPVPCMTVAQIEVKPDGANFAKGAAIARGRLFRADAEDADGNRVTCRFRATQETPLWPIRVEAVRLLAAGDSCLEGELAEVFSVVSVSLRAHHGEALQSLAPGRLRFYLDGEDRQAWQVHDLLALHLTGIALCPGGRATRAQPLGPEHLQWLGYDDEQAALPEQPDSHPGYRLVQEYFAFPEKFLFFDVDGLDFSGAGETCELLFLLNTPKRMSADLKPDLLRLNCVPLINLYPARLDPVRLDHSHYEYRLTGDITQHRHTEVYRVEGLVASRPGEAARPLAPWFALEDGRALEDRDYFYITRREASRSSNIAGSELYVSFLDTGANPTLPREEIVGGSALCSNRRLPELLRLGDPLRLEGPGPVDSVHIASKPTPHHTPALIGARPWALAGQLSLNHLSLVAGAGALAAFKDLLRQHVGPAAGIGLKQIDGLYQLTCRPTVRNVGRDAWRGFVPALHVRLYLDQDHFTQASAVLFASVLRHFLALYAAINTVVEVSLETRTSKGIVKQWQPLAGAQPIL